MKRTILFSAIAILAMVLSGCEAFVQTKPNPVVQATIQQSAAQTQIAPVANPIGTQASELLATATPGPTATPSGPACVGPAILETDYNGAPAVVKIDANQSFGQAGSGCFGDAFFHGNQAALNGRWITHPQEFAAKEQNAGGHAYIVGSDGQLVLVGDVVNGKMVFHSGYEPVVTVPTAVPSITPAPTSAATVVVVGTITPQANLPTSEIAPGKLAWHQDTSKTPYEASPVGQLGSPLRILAETWGMDENGHMTGYVVTIPKGVVAWFQYHYGGTGWWIADDVDIEALAKQHASNLNARDGLTPPVIILPDQAFPLLGCLQSKAIDNGFRTCDKVGNKASFTVKINEPLPGYYPGYGTGFSVLAPSTTQVANGTPVPLIQGRHNGDSCNDQNPVIGPAIVEDGTRGALIKVNSQETLNWQKSGSCWLLDSQASLEAAWPNEVTLFKPKNPTAPVYLKVSDVP